MDYFRFLRNLAPTFDELTHLKNNQQQELCLTGNKKERKLPYLSLNCKEYKSIRSVEADVEKALQPVQNLTCCVLSASVKNCLKRSKTN